MNKHSHIHVTSVILSEGDNRLLFKLQLFYFFLLVKCNVQITMTCSKDMFKIRTPR